MMQTNTLLLLSLLLAALTLVNSLSSTSTVDPPIYRHDTDEDVLLTNSMILHSERVKILLRLIKTACPDGQLYSRRKRYVGALDVRKTKKEIEVILYERLIRKLISCRQTASATTTTTTPKPPEPLACRQATNKTEYWRADHNGRKYNSHRNCDLSAMRYSRPWFRFSGSAGDMMLNRCPPSYSCGSNGGIWTDNTMPTTVGVATTVNAYASWSQSCKRYTIRISVMRCSADSSNFIYKYLYSSSSYPGCNYGFCGMSE